MKASVTIELEMNFSITEAKELDEILKKQGKTFNYHLSESMEKILVENADIPKKCIKSIEVNRLD